MKLSTLQTIYLFKQRRLSPFNSASNVLQNMSTPFVEVHMQELLVTYATILVLNIQA